MRIGLVVARQRTWDWHGTLQSALASHGIVDVITVEGIDAPAALRALLAIESVVVGQTPLGELTHRERPSITLSEAAISETLARYDVIVNLAGSPELASKPGVLTVYFDRRLDEKFLWGRLLRRECPYLEVREAADIEPLAASYPAIEDQFVLSRALACAYARVASLVERALLVRQGRVRSPAPVFPDRAPAQFSNWKALLFFGTQIAQKIQTLLAARRRGVWTVAIRRGEPSPAGALETVGTFTTLRPRMDAFYADPFLYAHEAQALLFAEEFPFATARGRIVFARIGADGSLGPVETALEQPHHLSYPFVFEHGGEVFMLPEARPPGGLTLYKAEVLPNRWRKVVSLLEGVDIHDATIIEREGRWWLFCAIPGPASSSWDELHAYWATSPFGPWNAHTLNPIKSDARGARPAGKLIEHNGKLYRPGQNCDGGYGRSLSWFEIDELTPETFSERLITEWSPSAFGAFTGLHTYNSAAGLEAIDLKFDQWRFRQTGSIRSTGRQADPLASSRRSTIGRT